jgi:hypothetical protein
LTTRCSRLDEAAFAGTGSTLAHLSPGITAQIMHKLDFYGVMQFPVYSNLDGYQLFPHWTVTAGLSYAF